MASVFKVMTSAEAADGEAGLTEEVWISKHIFILNDEAEQCNVRVDDVELANVVPRRVQPVVVVVAGLVLVVRIEWGTNHLHFDKRRRNSSTRLR